MKASVPDSENHWVEQVLGDVLENAVAVVAKVCNVPYLRLGLYSKPRSTSETSDYYALRSTDTIDLG